MPHNPRKPAFTLVELLVVIGVIALLISILLPVLTKAKEASNRTACRAHLHDIGSQFQMYLSESKNKLPWVNTMPSLQPPLNVYPSIVTVLQPYHKGAVKVFRCDSDVIKAYAAGAPAGFTTYYEREGSSYQYSTRLSPGYSGQHLADLSLAQNGNWQLIVIMNDFEPFHGPAGTLGAMNCLFADNHVGDPAE
ncbi:MAG: prepilin-type N-terminal cleavage/methylation domain-containing protein [Tepidisphaeraceae bacterium]|jgi:prepilin-type N-terminal cleavage/methylation domain-containing protein/prepilin-type processing-associated H-X9-DG protein